VSDEHESLPDGASEAAPSEPSELPTGAEAAEIAPVRDSVEPRPEPSETASPEPSPPPSEPDESSGESTSSVPGGGGLPALAVLDLAAEKRARAYYRLGLQSLARGTDPHVVWDLLLDAERWLAHAEGLAVPQRPRPAERLLADADEARAEVELLRGQLRDRFPARPVAVSSGRRWPLVLVAIAAISLVGVLAWFGLHATARHDLAAGKSWEASSAWGVAAKKGTLTQSMAHPFFHTAEDNEPWLDIDLGTVQRISRIEVVNRADFGPERAVPLTIAVGLSKGAHREVARRDQVFSTWTATMPPKTDARWIRLRVPRRTFLHLDDVRVY
jgi:hypothetical protein